MQTTEPIELGGSMVHCVGKLSSSTSHKRIFKTALALLSLTVLLAACQRRSIIEDMAGHEIIVSDKMTSDVVTTTGNGGWIPEPKTHVWEIRYEVNGKSVKRRIEITNEELSINGKAFGRMEPGVRIEIEGQRVLANSKEIGVIDE